MFSEDCRSVRASSEDHPLRRKDALILPFLHTRGISSSYDDNSAPSSSGVPAAGGLVVAHTSVTKYLKKARMFLDALRLSAKQQDDDKASFIDACDDRRHNSGLVIWKQRC